MSTMLDVNFLTGMFGLILLVDVVVTWTTNAGTAGAAGAGHSATTNNLIDLLVKGTPYAFIAYALIVTGSSEDMYRNLCLLLSVLSIVASVFVSTTTPKVGDEITYIARPMAYASFAVIPIILYGRRS